MIKEENKDAFLKVIETNKGIIYKVSRAYCYHDEDRKDLIQEIIIQLWNSFSKYNESIQKIITKNYRNLFKNHCFLKCCI